MNGPEVNGPMPQGQCVARFHVDLDERVTNAGYAEGYLVHVELNGRGRYFVLSVIKEPEKAT